jgi:inosine-uridine nucleoside N-ribohydrolase
MDTDPGNGIPGADIDDTLALALALRSPEIELQAITVVAGNVEVDEGVRAAQEVLEHADAAGVPVHRGAARPLVQDPSGWRRRLDQRRYDTLAQELWRDVDAPPSSLSADPQPAAQALVELIDAAPGDVTVVAVGPLTNVATAMLLDPEWDAKVARLVVMGGAFDVPNVLHELNFAYDPEATDMVLSSRAPLLIVPLDATRHTNMRLEDVDRLAEAGTALATYLARTVRPWVAWVSERFDRDGCALHDPLAMATLLDPDVVRTRTARAAVELRGSLTRGRVVGWDPHDEFQLEAGVDLPDGRPVEIADGVDNARFMPLLLDRLAS